MSHLDDLIRAELEASTEADPAIIAEHVLKRLAPTAMADALATALPPYVQILARRLDHNRARPSSSGTPGTPIKALAFIERKRLALSMDKRQWKFLADCTFDDLMAAVDIRRQLAEATLTEAARYGELADQMRQHGAETVRDLPGDVIAEALR